MTSKDLKVKLRPKHKITLPLIFIQLVLAMLNPYFILKNSMSENNFFYCRVYSKIFSQISFTKFFF